MLAHVDTVPSATRPSDRRGAINAPEATNEESGASPTDASPASSGVRAAAGEPPIEMTVVSPPAARRTCAARSARNCRIPIMCTVVYT